MKRGKIAGSPLVEVTVNSKEETLKTFVPILSYYSASVQEKRYGKALFKDLSEAGLLK